MINRLGAVTAALEGADRARAFLVRHGLPGNKADVAWDAIALNTSFGILFVLAHPIKKSCAGRSNLNDQVRRELASMVGHELN